MANSHSRLPIVDINTAIDNALKEVEEGIENEQQGLISRWPKLNKAALGNFRFGKTYVLGGMSGSGKSYILNMIRTDFLNRQLNVNFKKKYRLLHIAFEMTASDEMIRSVSGKVNMSYADILSSFKKLSQDEFNRVKYEMELMRNMDIDFIEVSGTVTEVENTILEYQAKHSDCLLVISLDHTLLTEYENEKDEVRLVTRLSRMFVKVRKQINCMSILVVQLNTEIEEQNRIIKPNLHYPIKRDIHGSKAIYQDADFIFIFHRPEILGISRYGPVIIDEVQGYETEDKIFCHVIKSRHSNVGIIQYKQEFHIGNMIELE